jgi:cell division protein FtsL
VSRVKGWVAMFVSAIAAVLVLGLSSVWLNIERMDLAYDLNKLEKELANRTALVAKLELERNNLISPYRLKRLAALYGLVPVGPGQMRIMTGQEKTKNAEENK